MKDELTCTWFQDQDTNEFETECGELFSLNEGTPSENGIKYCCYCGKLINTESEK